MFDYLQKYNNLSKEVRSKLSAPDVISAINSLEQKYNINLAATVMKVAVKDVNIFELAIYLKKEFNLDDSVSEEAARGLINEVFSGIAGYLGVEGRLGAGLTEKSAQKMPEVKKEMGRDSELPVFKASFFFSPEDEKEIKELSEKYNQYLQSSSFDYGVDDRLDGIIKKININFGSDFLNERFRKIIKTYIKGIRDRIETKQALAKSFDAGGLGFDEESAENVLLVAEGDIKAGKNDFTINPPKKIIVPEDVEKPEIKEKKEEAPLSREKLEELKNAGVRDMEYDLKSLKKVKVPEKLDTEHELAPPPPVAGPAPSVLEPKTKELAAAKPTEKPKEKEESKKPAVIAWPRPNIKQMDGGRRAPIRKVLMEDIKYEPKIMSPIDELRYMNLVDFRRLDKNPTAAAEKILEKINLLDEEYSKRIEGIKAWRVSPLNKIYLKIGEESIGGGKSVGEIIKERKAAGKDYLNDQEIEAIIELNRKLRF